MSDLGWATKLTYRGAPRILRGCGERIPPDGVTYILGAAFWNFVGAGVFGGGTLNAPLINYYEHATFLTLNHAHTALFGAFGRLARARSQQFYDTTLFWQWMRMPGAIVFAVGALLMAWDFLVKLGPLASRAVTSRGPAAKADAVAETGGAS